MSNKQTVKTIVIFGINIGVENPEEFQALLDRYTRSRGVSATKRDDGSVVMTQKDFDDFMVAREKLNLPTSERLHDIEVRLNHEAALFNSENNSSRVNKKRAIEAYAQNDFKLS